ncbi:MAG: nitronate monooxygenase [Clostridia bacterium]|nr:nitronate monooxygenase [Erysipelotrichia bacterium]NCC87587.1 nitronate monooxygenase [Clostridia bacterium]
MLKSVKLKDKQLDIPIIQGGMGVGVSLSSLAGNVMKQKGMGVISGAHPGYQKAGFRQDSVQANVEAIKEEVQKARIISEGNGLLGVNIMVASQDYDVYVKAAVQAKVDAIISGAGLPLHLPSLVDDPSILLAPIVSSGKAMQLVLKAWDRHYHRIPDFVVIEGSEAGGHLGFKKEALLDDTCETLTQILTAVQAQLKPYEQAYQQAIPIFVAGGIFTGADIAKYLKLGASGVQMGTRFIATHECDAHIAFKEAIIHCKQEDIAIVQSPTGFPGRAIVNAFMKQVQKRGNISVSHCLDCLKPCKRIDIPYCISEALLQSVSGNVDKGLIFVGSNAYRVKEMTSVEALMKELIDDANRALKEIK